MKDSGSEKLVTAARRAGVDDPRVLNAMRTVLRAAFVPLDQVELAYHDAPIPIPHGQVTTQPSLSATMIQALRLAGTEHVLEVGTGYGYQTALLAQLASFVTSIERWPDLAEMARQRLTAQNIINVNIVDGDGTEGVPAAAPFDAILVSAAFPKVPPPLVDQLRVGGRLVQPIGRGGAERVTVFERSMEGLVPLEVVSHARFVRLYGRHGYE
ncbi:MAG TPA: protein-L-isoaspartate(D-aspartate) O-methyltransferase [Propionibacteriaceae bacterium]|nr:protein-L-isoaspartate(D-aspartate) O-methyltransferase [Propionibacteriaceae bacterium]